MLVPNVNHYTDQIHGRRPQLYCSCFAAYCQYEIAQRSLWPQEDCGHNPKNLHSQSNGFTLTRTSDVADDQGLLLGMHMSRFGWPVSSCQNRFWGSWHKLIAGTKKQKKVVFHPLHWTGALSTLCKLFWCYSWYCMFKISMLKTIYLELRKRWLSGHGRWGFGLIRWSLSNRSLYKGLLSTHGWGPHL